MNFRSLQSVMAMALRTRCIPTKLMRLWLKANTPRNGKKSCDAPLKARIESFRSGQRGGGNFAAGLAIARCLAIGGKEIIAEELPDFHLRPEWKTYRSRLYTDGAKAGVVQHAITKDILLAFKAIAGGNKVTKRKPKGQTGPRTTEGRAISKLNACKHGVLSKQVLVRGHAFKESSRELNALHKRFWDDLQPVGLVEEMLVDQIVTAHWRLRRALMAESGHIALGVDSGHRKHGMDNTAPTLLWIKWRALGDPIHAMGQSSLGNVIVEGWLRDLNSAVEAEGEFTVAMVENLNAKFGAKDSGMGRR